MWQPFETAPTKPGVSFLVYFPNRRNKYHVAVNMNDFRIIGGVFDFDFSDKPALWMEIPVVEPQSAIDKLKELEKEYFGERPTSKPLFADLIAQHPGLKEELAEMGNMPPTNCRQRLSHEGKNYPRSSCEVCGKWSPKWRECDAAIQLQEAIKQNETT